MGHSVIQTNKYRIEVKGSNIWVNGHLICENQYKQAKFTTVSNIVFLVAGFLAGGFCCYQLLFLFDLLK